MPLSSPVPIRSGPPAPTRRRLLQATVLSGATLLVGGTTACTEEPTDPANERVELSVFWWGGKERATLTERALALYSRRHPSVTFRLTWQGETGYYDRLATQTMGGNAPDLFQIDDGHLSEYAHRRIVLDLTDFVADGRIDLRNLPPSLVQYGRIGGRTVAVAAAGNTPGLIYNRSLLRRLKLPEPHIGMSYDEFFRWIGTVGRRSEGRVAGTMDPSGDYRALWLWLRTHGRELYHGRQVGFTVDDLTRWLDMWQSARSNRTAPGPVVVRATDEPDPARQPIVSGRVATVFAWADELPELQRHTGDELAVISYPGAPEAHWARASMYWAGFHGTRHPQTVADVIDFLTNETEVGRVLGAERGLNANLNIRRVVEQSLTDQGMKRVAAFENAMSSRFGPAPVPPPKGHGRVRALLATTAESARSGQQTSRGAAIQFIARANAALVS
ncbi:extracellular solute-binding protein [Micromonospora sonneratiae]|uniref:ABC transporter substrate-binding protein n=1 Tax=Micromonospora sonneratiae TaxID=1184706 RepID=A0ABW3YIG6_9ACTN